MGEFDKENELLQGRTLEDCFVRAKLLPYEQLDESHACDIVKKSSGTAKIFTWWNSFVFKQIDLCLRSYYFFNLER